MYKIIISIFTGILFCLDVFAQSSQIVFLGSITVSGGKSYPYKLFINDSDGILTGYSLSDITGADETKTLIKGSKNANKKQLTFRETKLVYTKSATEMCYLHTTLKAGTMQGAATLSGNFKGYRIDGKTKCGKGKLMLVGAQDILDKLMEIAKQDSIFTAPKVATRNGEKPINEAEIIKILPGERKEVVCNSADVELEIWDAKSNDGDIITLLQDGEPLLEQYQITYRHKVLHLRISDSGSTTLQLVAINEGSEALNTAQIKITSGGVVQHLDASTTLGKDVIIVLKM